MPTNLPIFFTDSNYTILKSHDGVILVNTDMDGFAHTHLENSDTAMWLIGLSKSKRIPRDIARYLLISLLRVNDDETYCRKINELMANRKKKEKYRNCPCIR